MLLSVAQLTRQVGSKTLFRDVSFELRADSILALTGPSGSGKSSLLRCVAGLDRATTGDVLLDGKSQDTVAYAVWRSNICYVAQHPPALRGTARQFAEQVQGLRVQRARATSSPYELGEEWGLESELWDREFAELSGGEQQRALLALAVSRKPQLLLLDEPTSALDADTTARVETTLLGSSVIWVTHDVAQAKRVARKILELPA